MIDEETLTGAVHFHGHLCPGLALGIRATEIALEVIGPHAVDEEVVAIVETDMCGVDGIQFLTGCTFGKGNMIHRDYGKNAYTFVRLGWQGNPNLRTPGCAAPGSRAPGSLREGRG